MGVVVSAEGLAAPCRGLLDSPGLFLNFSIVGHNPAVEICGKYSLVGRNQSTIMRPNLAHILQLATES